MTDPPTRKEAEPFWPIYDAINDAEMLGEGFNFTEVDHDKYPKVFGYLSAPDGYKLYLPMHFDPEKMARAIRDYVSRHRKGS